MEKRSVSIKLIWMGAYFVVVIVMCFVFFLGTIMVMRTTEENARQVNEDNAAFMQNSLDDTWQRVFEYSLQIINHSTARSLESAGDAAAFKSREAYELSMEFSNYSWSNQMVEDLYLYYPTRDYVIGINGVYTSHVYWASLYGVTKEYSETTWKNQLFGNRKTGYFTVQNGNHLDLYYRMAAVDITGRMLVVKINTQELESTLGWICSDNENSFLGMVDENGYIYAYSGNYEKFADAENNRLLEVDDREYLSTQTESYIQTLRYITITEKSQAFHQSSTVMRLALICLLFAFASGVGASFFFVRRTSRPVRKLAEKLGGEDGIVGNELQLISAQVDDLLQENKQALDALARQQNMMIYRTFLNECLKFQQTESRDVETIAAICGLSFENSYYIMVVRERSGSDDSAGIISLLEGMEDTDDLILWTQRQDLDVILVNYDDSRILTELLKDLRTISSGGSRIVTSKQTDSPENIRSDYLDCLRQLQRKEVVLLPHSAEPKKEFEDLQGKSILGSFQKYLADEDYSNARQLVPELCRSYLNSAEPLERTCCRYAVIQQFLHLKSSMDMRRQLTALAKEEDAAQFEKLLGELLSQCSRWKLMHQESDNDIAGKARCIVDEMYADPLLSLRMISEEIGISQSYVSRMFKKKYGIGIAQYINQVRIEGAKKLIRSGSQNIKAISMQVGFSSDVQFIRVFKKLEGITPGTFRTENTQTEEN